MDDADRHQRLFELYERFLERPDHELEAFLDEHCADDPELRLELLAMRRAEEREVTFLDTPKVSTLWQGTLGPGSLIGRRIGGYFVEEEIAAGGMGIVYKARQERPKRWVAIKVSKQGLRERSVKRFEFEAEVLGRLKHPGIAEIYDAGTFEDPIGTVPYFVMEYIEDARPITRYGEERGLDTRARIELFVQACEAVHAGHQKSVIHRDLKPENLLVDGQGRVKVIDFGVACVTDRDLRLTTFETGLQAVIGTLPYMSPEQVSGDPAAVDFRSDVYSLGVVLHQMLTGRVPIDLERTSIPDAVRRIVEEDPERIGARDPSLRGDLETIVAKALEKDKERRYGMALDLANDLRRYLNDEPIQARPQTTWYQLRKFTKRNKGLVFGVLVAAFALVLGLVLSVSQAIRATEARDEAEAARSRSLYQLYRASIAAAASAIETHDLSLARTSLEAAPRELRRWEWFHLRSRLDQSVHRIPLEEARVDRRARFLRGTAGEAWIELEGTKGRRWIDLVTGEPVIASAPSHRVVTPAGTELRWNEAGRPELITDQGQQPLNVAPSVREAFLGPPADWRLTNDRAWLLQVDSSSVHAWSTRDGSERSIDIPSSPTGLQRWAWSSAGHVAFAASDRGTVLWHPETNALAPLLDVPAFVRTVAFHPDGLTLAVGLQDTTVRLFDGETRRQRIAVGRGHRHAVTDLVWSPSGETLVSVSLDRSLRFWDARTLEPRGTLHGHESGIWSVSTSDDGAWLATTSEDGTLRLWSTHVPKPGVLGTHANIVYPVAFRPDGTWIASAGWDDRIRLWDARGGDLVAEFARPAGTSVPTALAFDAEGTKLIALADRLYGFDLRTGRPLPGSDATRAPRESFLPVKYLAFLNDSVHVPLPWTLDEERVTLWNTETGGTETCTRTELHGRVPALESPDGRFLVVPAHTSEAALDVRRARGDVVSPITFLDRETENLLPERMISRAFAFAPRGSLVALRREDGDGRDVEIWDLARGALRGRLRGHGDAIYDLAWSADGSRLFTAGRDALRIWDASTFEEIVPLHGHTSFVWSLAFNPDGTLASGSGDGTVRLWNDRDLRGRLKTSRRRAELERTWDSLPQPPREAPPDPWERSVWEGWWLGRARSGR